jgi:hypothetical protein
MAAAVDAPRLRELEAQLAAAKAEVRRACSAPVGLSSVSGSCSAGQGPCCSDDGVCAVRRTARSTAGHNNEARAHTPLLLLLLLLLACAAQADAARITTDAIVEVRLLCLCWGHRPRGSSSAVAASMPVCGGARVRTWHA